MSQHLKALRLAGLVAEQRIGTRRVYRLDPAGLEAVRAYFDRFWERSLTAFKQAVEQPTSPPTMTQEAP